MRTIESNRFVTGVTWVDGELWHGTWEGDESDIRRIDPDSGAVLERLEMPRGTGVSGLESDGADLFYCGGGASGKVRAVRRPKAPGQEHTMNTTITERAPRTIPSCPGTNGLPSARRCWRAKRN